MGIKARVKFGEGGGCADWPAQLSGESTRPKSTVTSSHSRMSCTVAAAIMNLPRSESILPTGGGEGGDDDGDDGGGGSGGV